MKARWAAVSAAFVLIIAPSASASPPPGFMDSPIVTEPLPVRWMVDGSIAFPASTKAPGDANEQYLVLHAMPQCAGTITSDCISSLSILNGSTWESATFVEYVPVSWKGANSDEDYYERDAAHLVPASRQSSLWRIPGLTHAGGDLYMVTVQMAAEMTNHSQPLAAGSQADWQYARASIDPVRIHIGSRIEDTQDPERIICLPHARATDEVCIERFDFIGQPRLRLDLRLELTKNLLNVRHWLTGRALDASATSTRNPDATTTIRLEGVPLSVIEAKALIPRTREGYAELVAAINAGYRDSGVSNAPEEVTEEGFQFFLRIGSSGQSGEMANFAYFSHLEALYPINIHRQITMWRFMTTNVTQSEAGWLWPCAPAGEISGLTASNATILRAGPPTWDTETKTLRFRAASTHLDKDGKQNIGFYGLTLSEKVATCLWGGDISKAKATVEVTDQSGETQVATTTFSIKNGMVYFQAAGFHYSVAGIAVSLKVPEAASTGTTGTTTGTTTGITPAVTVRTFTTCKALWAVYRSGVAKSASTKDRQRRAKGKPTINKSLYLANQTLDTDKDGWACER